MGDHGGCVQPSGLLPNGLLPNQIYSVNRTLDSASWMKAEERTAELITCIQPNQPSEERRNAVADYVQRLIIKCFPCQVFTFGSVPLKTYLPDGDIDLTAFSNNQSLKDTWANKVRDMLEEEEKNESADFNVKEVQYIQAEVKIIKCLVENIVVDISFNQLGGLCTLCFLEEVDHLINQNHLFKRSIILIKAWCYYESRILGAHHGLISTYALETLVLYIFHVFNSSFTGPLEVLFRFLEFFSNFDWDNFCVSLWGPVPISSLPDVSAEPPRKDGGELLLSKLFLDACSSVYAVFPSGHDNQGQPFVSKHFNVIDPLRINNNLGRSVSKGNFFRIRSAFAFGAEKLAKVVECSKERCISEVNHFFNNTWDRHGNGRRPDTRSSLPRPPKLPHYQHQPHDLDPNSSNLSHNNDFPALTTSRTKDTLTPPLQKLHGGGLRNPKPYNPEMISQTSLTPHPEKPTNDFQRRSIFARTRSSPELSDARSRGSHNRAMASGNGYALSNSKDSRRKIQGPESGCSVGPGKVNPCKGEDVSADSGSASHTYNIRDTVDGEQAHQEEQDMVNLLGSSSPTFHKYNGPMHIPLRFPVSSAVLSPVGYPQRSAIAASSMVPANLPLIEPSWISAAQFSQGFMRSSPLAHYFPTIDMSSNQGNFSEPGNETFRSVENNSREGDQDIWHEMDMAADNGSFEMLQLEDKQHTGFDNSFQAGSSAGFYNEQWDLAKDNHSVPYEYQEDRVGEPSFEYRMSTPHAMSSQSEAESSWDGPRPRAKKPGRKTDYNKGKGVPENTMPYSDKDARDRGRNRPVGSELEEASTSDPIVPPSPVMAVSGSRQRETEDSGIVSLAFYPTGPPVPFLTMLPVYNYPDGTHFGGVDVAENGDGEGSEGGDVEVTSMGSSRTNTSVGPPDILTSDFTSHWQNLQYGRLCQNPRLHWPVVYPPPVVVPPVYLQGHFPWDGPGRPVSPGNVNFFTQVMGYGPPRFVPVAPNRPSGGGAYQRYMDEIPKYRSGTGTYLPNPKVSGRDRHSSGSRRTGYNQDRGGDHHNERDGNWSHWKGRTSGGRNHGRVQAEKQQAGGRSGGNEGRSSDKQWGSYKHDHFQPYHHHSHNPQLHPNQVASSISYGGVYSGGVASPSQNGAPLQSLVMFYPYDHTSSTYTLPEFTSFRHTSDSQQQQPGGEDGRSAMAAYYDERGSPDRPSSPRKQW